MENDVLLSINEIGNREGWRRSVENNVPLGINEIGNGGDALWRSMCY